jgi:hypothetical protein
MTLFFIKRSRLANSKTGQKKCPKNDHWNIGLFGIRWPTVFVLWPFTILKWSRLTDHSKTGHICPVFEWSGFQMTGSRLNWPFEYQICPVFTSSLYKQNSKTDKCKKLIIFILFLRDKPVSVVVPSKSSSKVRGPTYVKVVGRKGHNIKPASHFTERRSYEQVAPPNPNQVTFFTELQFVEFYLDRVYLDLFILFQFQALFAKA